MATLITTNVNGTLTTTGTITSGNAFVLPGGFTINHPGNGYAQFSSWVHLPDYHGFYSTQNGAHFYPNNATYGSWRISGTRNGWHGIHFDSGATLMMNSNETGVHRESYGWQFRWENGTMYCHKNSYGGGTSATVLDSSNAPYAWNMNQYVRTTDAVTFATVDTGQGATEVHLMNQNLRTTDSVRFNSLGVNVAASATAGRIDAGNDIVAFSSSDERLKENIVPIQNALEKVMSLTGVEFDWKPEHKDAHGYEGHDTGIIAQQVQNVIPSAVRTNQTGFLAVRYEKLIGLLIEGMKEQQAQIEELRSKLK